MGKYLEFKPSKEEIYRESIDDEFYLFRGNRILANRKIDYGVPDREYIEDNELPIKDLQCLGAYDRKNYYCGTIDDDYRCEDFEYISLREFLEKNPDYNKFLIASKAFMLVNHIRENRKCGRCGSDMMVVEEGNDRSIRCSSCSNIVWPTNAPAIIVGVTKGDKLLLAHNNRFEEGVYSLIAGFLEMGESLEQCVKRELLEETGIKVDNIKYFGSQPWPFPNSMMIGFTADYLSGEIEVDNDEILEAKWFSKEEIPGKYIKSRSIGSKLIEDFMKNH